MAKLVEDQELLEKSCINLVFLDGIRGLAALYVVIFHARWLLWEGYSTGYLLHPEKYSIMNKFFVYFFSLFKYGHEAVILFFVLSGFVIHLKNSVNLKNNTLSTFSLKDYFLKRCNRIYGPLLLSFIVTYISDSFGMFQGFPIYFDSTIYPHIHDQINSDLSITTLLGNSAFLMDSVFPVYGSNGPLWSLFYEWWFYMLYPIFLFFSRKSINLSYLLPIVLLIISFIIPTSSLVFFSNIFSYFIIWCLGAFLADIYTKRITIPFKYSSLLILTPILPIITNLKIGIPVLSDFLAGLVFFGFFSLCFYLMENGVKLSILENLKKLGDMSYTLYIIHLPILVYISGYIMKNNEGFLPKHFVYVVLGTLAILPIAYICYLMIEKPFNTYKPIVNGLKIKKKPKTA